jgi:hypothetical protein
MYDTCDEVTPGSQIGEVITHHFSANQRKIWFKCSFQCYMFKMHSAFKLYQVHLFVLVLNYFQGHAVHEDNCLTLKRKAMHNFKSSGTTHSKMLHHISDYWNFKFQSSPLTFF